MEDLRDLIRTIPDFPKPGILFRDVTTLLGHRTGFHKAITLLVARYQASRVDKVAGNRSAGLHRWCGDRCRPRRRVRSSSKEGQAPR
jgi:adenine/guanine phosphoribosyltransferase-like PRPP-binding protein